MWMPAGSFWTQPKGEVHITSGRGEETIAYMGSYLGSDGAAELACEVEEACILYVHAPAELELVPAT